MTFHKIKSFDEQAQETARLAKAISHPARVEILRFLSQTQVCMSGDICDHIPLARATVSQHLKELKLAGLIKGDVEGTKVNYCLNECGIKELKKYLGNLLDDLNCCKSNNC